MTETEMITGRQWDSYARRIERRNLKTNGVSLSAASIKMRAREYIVDIRLGEQTMLVCKGWRAAMREVHPNTTQKKGGENMTMKREVNWDTVLLRGLWLFIRGYQLAEGARLGDQLFGQGYLDALENGRQALMKQHGGEVASGD